jgi:hypothetical protein
MAFAILRTEKIKTAGNAGGLNNHLERKMEVPNADQELTPLNRRPVGSDDLWNDIKGRIEAAGVTPRKNAVLAVEHLITFSPEWVSLTKTKQANGTCNLTGVKGEVQKVSAFFKEATQWLQERYGKENVVNIHIHFDEATPHMHAIVVPIDKKGKLNCRDFLGGREKLREMQTGFANRVKHLGLERGIEGSKAQHTTLKEFYSMTKEATKQILVPMRYPAAEDPITIDAPPHLVMNPEKWAQEQQQKINAVFQRSQAQLINHFNSRDKELKEYASNSVFKQFKDTLQLREQKGLQKKEEALKAKYEGNNKVLAQRLDLLEKTLAKQGMKFNYEKGAIEKIEMQEKKNRGLRM